MLLVTESDLSFKESAVVRRTLSSPISFLASYKFVDAVIYATAGYSISSIATY
jgi:hypothetical protein